MKNKDVTNTRRENRCGWSDNNGNQDDLFGDSDEVVTVNCGLEINTPTGQKVLCQKVLPAKDFHGTFSTCVFGNQQLKQLVYTPEYWS
mmetsp:Transcript_50984/g.108590  ORF Transcript_50984/g.108590 Transcript_50984/m.108590 type:complete len:88 (+) Transcript_50984:67-330(+)|eukprot:CAMPEP_0172571928 /NCGR_PEP_ID=MMETSP1067-20121228/133160_1 /TAXON_ID=265564 ORGANISM="Thalassiosira punctigera, Strain Tpunct2005C2" /NCGR_SAMPLE_ID=MMETSP1067 /ASSEMBLY_ACC=CAM_ASM_000444 /LENGTH=87 /DNA_ID=CAMNT_0013364369 /DNA_START=50 /DNA_END=313 /DNA_ORIENTATION=+